jgi:PIN domain nuclease of toxin-antitoxin system
MKKYLLDTQILIWFFSDNLQKSILQILENKDIAVYLSVINVWEIMIKSKKGKLKTPSNLQEAIQKSGFGVLDVKLDHVYMLNKLPSVHADPFDRMLIAQANSEKLTLVSSDKKFEKYKTKLLKV